MASDLQKLKADLGPRVERLRSIEEEWRTADGPKETGLILLLDQSHVYYVLQEVERLDRELRRTARAYAENKRLPLTEAIAESIQGSRATSKKRDSGARESTKSYGVEMPARSSLRLADAGEGSTDLLLLPLGGLISLFASEPLTAIANAFAWSGPIQYIRTWSRSDHDALKGVSARQAFAAIREAGRDPQNLLGPPSAEVTLADGTAVRGSRIVVTRHHADGSTDVFEVTG